MPAMLLWALLALLAVPALALAEPEAPPSDAPALVEEQAPLDQFGAPPNGEAEIQFVPEPQTPVDPAPSAETPPVTPAPTDPVTNPAPTDPAPPGPVGEEPVDPTVPVGEEPVGETPVEEQPVGSVLDNSPEQEPVDAPVYLPPVTAFPPVDIPVAAAVPLPAEIPAEVVRNAEVAPPAGTVVPPTAPITRTQPVTRAVTIPSGVIVPARPAVAAPKPKSQFATGADLVRSGFVPTAPAVTPKEPDTAALAPGVDKEAALGFLQPRLTSPVGPAPGGSQFFEVLAQYVMAGGSGPPTGVALMLLVQIATVIAAFAWRTPRSMFQMILGVSDRLSVGYRAVALRPG